MKYKCQDIQALILEGKVNEEHRHIKTCTECVQFLNAHADLTKHYDITALKAPIGISFNNIYSKATQTLPKKTKITYAAFSKIIAVAASLLITFSVLPIFFKTPIAIETYIHEINASFNSLDTSIDSLEINLANNQELFSISAIEIEKNINYLQKEIST